MAPSAIWQALGQPAPETLSDARLQLHWAAQVAAAAGFTHLPSRADDSHTSLTWQEAHGALVGEPLAGGLRAGLRLADLSLLVLVRETVRATLPLEGRTLADGYRWLAESLAQYAGGALEGALRRRDYDMPGHPVQTGRPFGGTADALAEVTRWYGNAAVALARFRVDHPEASEVRCWPHHFDLATLVTVAPGTGENARTVGVGMSPGDSSYAEPYYYVTPWPYPKDRSGPALPGSGRWHTAGWFGAVLVGSALPRAAADQAEIVDAFVRSAFAASAELVAAAG